MKFSMAWMMTVMGFVSVVLAAAFAMPPLVGFFVLTFISVAVMPQLIWIGAINSRGRKQAFFIGAILSGIPHFTITSYCLFLYAVEPSSLGAGDELGIINIIHVAGYVVGLLGGVGGVLSHCFIVPEKSVYEAERPLFEADGDLQNSPTDLIREQRETSAFRNLPK